MTTNLDGTEYTLLGCAVYQAQKIEFALYGIIAHLNDQPEFNRSGKFKGLTAEQFLRGDFKSMRATLGDLNKFTGRLLLASPDFENFVSDRNLLVHNYFRQFHTAFGDAESTNGVAFLTSFLENGRALEQVLKGLLVVLREAVAAKTGALEDLVVSEADLANKARYLQYVELHRLSAASE
ncbi:hypothetical protein ACQKP1_01015 [Allorhizobium sp. NPDC080224]|uniref:hypothetical protein n=1 Tax=Allorhizobium sp. NPDC080224 TaxID=3390547 RepID=UPI003D07EF31